MASRATSLCLSLALSLLVATWGVAPASAATCSDVCTVNGTSATDPLCQSDCETCINSATGKCWNYFVPQWTSDTLINDDGSMVPTYNSVYLASYCVPVCPLPWWGWLLVALSVLFFVLCVAWCCYTCVQRRRRNREAALAAAQYQSQMVQPNPYPQGYSPHAY